ncbi:MAG: DUF6489 family protein [Hyphomicrobiaceae bacterium]
MKITVEVDCTPQEARTFLGLPDVSAINETITQDLQRRTEANLETLADPEKFYRQVLDSTLANSEAMQKMFAALMSKAANP